MQHIYVVIFLAQHSSCENSVTAANCCPKQKLRRRRSSNTEHTFEENFITALISQYLVSSSGWIRAVSSDCLCDLTSMIQLLLNNSTWHTGKFLNKDNTWTWTVCCWGVHFEVTSYIWKRIFSFFLIWFDLFIYLFCFFTLVTLLSTYVSHRNLIYFICIITLGEAPLISLYTWCTMTIKAFISIQFIYRNI